MSKDKQYLSEEVCSGCGHTGHITWEDTDNAKVAVEMSKGITQVAGDPPTFNCGFCGKALHPA